MAATKDNLQGYAFIYKLGKAINFPKDWKLIKKGHCNG